MRTKRANNGKLKGFAVVAGTAAVLSASSAGASIVNDNFNDTTGSGLNGDVATTGQTWGAENATEGGAGGVGTDMTVTNVALSYPGLPTDNNSVLLSAANNPTQASGGYNVGAYNNDRVNLASITSGSVYYSFLLNVPTPGNGYTGGGAGSPSAAIAEYSPGGSGGPTSSSVGELFIIPDTGAPGYYFLGIGDYNQGLSVNFESTPYAYGTTVFVVGATDLDNNSDSLWVDPSSTTAAPSATVSGSGVSHIGSFAFVQGNTNPDSEYVSELSVDTSFANVDAIVPEPASLSLISLGVAGMLLKRRGRKA